MHIRLDPVQRVLGSSRWLIPLLLLAGCGDNGDIGTVGTAPELTILSPAEGDTIRPGPLYIKVDMDDFDAGQEAQLKAQLDIQQNNTTLTSCTGTGNTEGVFECTTSINLTAGSYRLVAMATDPSRRQSDAATRDFTVINAAPACTFVTPASGSSQNYDQGIPVSLQVQTSDDFDPADQIEVCLDSDVAGRLAPCRKAPSTGPVLFQVEFPKSGSQVVTASCKDLDGAEGKDNFTAVVAPCEDEDGDGFSPCASVAAQPDCDDDDEFTYPGADEICDEKDNNCDRINDNPPDRDGDGFDECEGDCDDQNLIINPNGTEICNGKDDDCDESTDEGFDTDNDTYVSCPVNGRQADCDDTNPATFPGAVEICDGKENNCNTILDDRDLDKDGYVDAECTQTTASQTGDCNDNNKFINPGMPEQCDGIDEDCDGRVDDHTVCADDDGDGYCEEDCSDGSLPGDCDDNFPFTYPSAVERFDGNDNNCDGQGDGQRWPISKAWVVLNGTLQSGQTGFSIDGGEDINGDTGYGGDELHDMIVGSPFYDPAGNNRGAAFVILGRNLTDWPVGAPTDIDDLQNSFIFSETTELARAGSSVAMVPDADGDGLGEFAVGAPYATVVIGGSGVPDAGTAYLFLSKGRTLSNSTLNSARTRVSGTVTGVLCGDSVAGGDINGDGLADFLVGGPDSGGDLTLGGGWGFFLFGRTSDSWPSSARPTEIYKLSGSASNALGSSIAFIGHHTQDSLGDFVIGGAYNGSDSGGAWRIPGSEGFKSGAGANIDEVQAGSWLGKVGAEMVGSSISGMSDINYDGYDDIFIGRANRPSTTSPIAYAMFGGNYASPTDQGDIDASDDVAFIGTEEDSCPCEVAGIGDMNGDGIGDLAISASRAKVNGLDAAGRVYLLYGRDLTVDPWPESVDLSTEADAVFEGEITNQRIGASLGSLGDINGDGAADLAIGAPNDSAVTDKPQMGRVYIQWGSYQYPYSPYND